MASFGKLLIKAREKQNITQKRLAEMLDITPTRLNYWEKDKREPSVEMIKKISAVLHISISDLFEWDEFDRRYPDVGQECKEFEDFIAFLKSIGYTVKFFPEDEKGNNFTAELTKNGVKTAFSENDFENLKLEVKKSIDYQVWQKSQENK